MAGENPGETPQGDEIIGRLDQVIDRLDRIIIRFDKAADVIGGYKPALDKALKLADSPAAKVAAKVGHWRGNT